MQQNFRKNNKMRKGLLAQLLAEKKKAVIALSLITVMVLMWGRVLGRKAPRSAKAAQLQANAGLSTTVPDSQSKMFFVKLPKIEGRNDVLARDFFASDNWQNFFGEKRVEEVTVVSQDGDEELVAKIRGKLRLGAIGLGETPQVFINDKLLGLGDSLFVGDGVKTYECEVTRIAENAVFIRCGEVEIKLKIRQAIEEKESDR